MFLVELHVIIIIIGFHVAYLADPGKPVRSRKRHKKSLQALEVHYDNNNSNNNYNKASTGLMLVVVAIRIQMKLLL